MVNLLFSAQNIRAVIFDCDGTLVDSEQAHRLAWKKTMQKRGSDYSSDQALRYTGRSDKDISQFLSQDIGTECAPELLADKRLFYRDLFEQGLPPIEPTVEFLKLLAKEKEHHRLKIGLASSAPKTEILSHLTHLGIVDAFDIILSGQDDLKDYVDPEGTNKPKPYIYLHAAKILGLSPNQCVVLEDTKTGVMAGLSAGCFTIAIPNVYTEFQDFSAAHLKLESLEGVSVEQFLQRVERVSKK